MRIAVIGNGIVGTCAAAWLQRDGHKVVFIDPLGPAEATSFGNAGSLSPSACLPVGMPGMWKKVPGWLLDRLGPLTVRWWYAPVAAPWLVRFLRASSPAEVTRIATAMRGLLAPIFECYEPLLQRAGAMGLMRRTGCLYVYSSQDIARQWAWGMNLRRSLGVELRDVKEDELVALEPDLKGRFRFGILAPENGSTLDPAAFTRAIFAQCERDGAEIVRARATGFRQQGGSVTAVTLDNGEEVACDGVVLAGGAWSARLARHLGPAIPRSRSRRSAATTSRSRAAISASRTPSWRSSTT